jgi:hypothetical protein
LAARAVVTTVPPPAGGDGPAIPLYLGCFKDLTDDQRDLSGISGEMTTVDDVIMECSAICAEYMYFGLQWANQCFCDNAYGSQGSSDACGAASDISSGECGIGRDFACGSANAVYHHDAGVLKKIEYVVNWTRTTSGTEPIYPARSFDGPLRANNKLPFTVDLPLEYTIGINITAGFETVVGWGSIYHFTATDSLTDDCCAYGSRIPGMWFYPGTRKLLIVDGHKGQGNSSSVGWDCLPADMTLDPGVEYNVKLVALVETVEVYIDDRLVCSGSPHGRLDGRQSWPNVNVYLADPWHDPAVASVHGLYIQANNVAMKQWSGGCANYGNLQHVSGILYPILEDQTYTVDTCLTACKALHWCTSFFLGAEGESREGNCLPMGPGCTRDKSNPDVWTYYLVLKGTSFSVLRNCEMCLSWSPFSFLCPKMHATLVTVKCQMLAGSRLLLTFTLPLNATNCH